MDYTAAQQRESDRLIIGQLPLLLDRHPEVMQAIVSDYILHTHRHLIDLVTNDSRMEVTHMATKTQHTPQIVEDYHEKAAAYMDELLTKLFTPQERAALMDICHEARPEYYERIRFYFLLWAIDTRLAITRGDRILRGIFAGNVKVLGLTMDDSPRFGIVHGTELPK